MRGEEILAVYRLRVDEAQLEARAEALLLEQTVELPRAAVRSAFARENIIGRVVSAEAAGPDGCLVTLAQPAAAAAADPAQLLNVLFGNCSLQPDVTLEDVRLPADLSKRLGGPRFGITGIRRLTGVAQRALTASVLKPVGISPAEAAELCGAMAAAGVDIIKDDHGLADHPFCRFEDRVRACVAAVDEVAQRTGRRSLYVPNLMGAPAAVMHQAWAAKDIGALAVMVAPMLLGLPLVCELAGDLELPILAHPAFAGTLRISAPALLGTLFRHYGCDAVIYPNAGGRFAYGPGECAAIAAALRAPLPGIAPAFPVPAGGIRRENAGRIVAECGSDVILLVGGSLLEAPDMAALEGRLREFVEAVHGAGIPG
ncbi:MAG TPA: RuBisCO large subunit C-terminal-like domain-containing protein [Opitutaceae bacterium]|jgi:ribulose-bisphosphate carboxylase large chain